MDMQLQSCCGRVIESIALEDSLDDILINSVAPGPLNTNMLKQVLNAGPDKVGKVFMQKLLNKKIPVELL